MAFFVLAGSLDKKLQDHPRWLAELVASVTKVALPGPLWPAVFSFDERDPTSALRVTGSSPIRAMTANGDFLDGVVTVSREQLSPSALCYLWIWAAIHASDTVHGMDFRFMRDTVEKLCGKEGGLEVLFRPDNGTGGTLLSRVSLLLPEDQTVVTLHVPADEPAPAASDAVAAVEHAEREERAHSDRRVMLITLGSWVDEPDSWDESAWGGNANATRRGYGYYPGMSDEDLLSACRLFWKFNPDSATWRGIDHAVVAHDGRTRAVVRIDRFIGPFWGRHGFQGHVHRRLARDYERDPATSEAMIRWAAINTMTSRIARGEPATRQQRWHWPDESRIMTASQTCSKRKRPVSPGGH